MKCIESLLVSLVTLGLFATACASSVPAETVLPQSTPTSSAVVALEPTAVEVLPTVASVSDAERIEAATVALDADGVRDLIAWDVLESAVDDGGIVTLRLCGWNGVDVFDGVFVSLWDTSGGSGEVQARELGTSIDAGECLNSELIDSAFEFLADYEAYWIEMNRFPERFTNDDRTSLLMTAERVEDSQVFLRRKVDDGSYTDFAGLRGRPDEVAVTDVLYRRHRRDGNEFLELAYCRDVDPRYGSYRDGVRFDDFKSTVEGVPGPHFADVYRLVRTDSGERWLFESVMSLVWADCLAVEDDWSRGLQAWLPDLSGFQAVS